jgi:ABC-type Fe3+-siderophore transport system permease subunit
MTRVDLAADPATLELRRGVVTAMIGAPYFVWLLWRSRKVTA